MNWELGVLLRKTAAVKEFDTHFILIYFIRVNFAFGKKMQK